MSNLFGGWWRIRRSFGSAMLDDLAAAIAAGERTHLGELRLAVESRLHPGAVLAGLDATARARQVFGQLGVWDTERNSGVLLYVLLSERRIEIVVDRGVAARVSPAQWDDVSAAMRQAYARGQWREGSLAAITAAHALLRAAFPPDGSHNNEELPDRPVLL
ncbi:MAG: TPM domain-containing protein [Rhodanobacter sp.]